jgi:hypothetical protein
MESDLKAAMDERKGSVIASLDDVELIDIVRQDILENDCYRLASELIITSEQNRTNHLKYKSLKGKLDRLKILTTRL